MYRIRKVTVLFFLFGSLTSQAGWNIEILRGKDAPKGYKEAGLLQRYVNTEFGPIQIATISTAVYEKNSSEPKTEDDFAKKSESLIQGLKWKKQKYKGVSVYSAYLDRDLRQFKMMIKDHGNHRIFTLSNIKQPFSAGTAYETAFLQRVFMKRQIDLLKGGKKSALLWSQFIQDVEAQSITDFISPADLSRMLTTFNNKALGGVDSAKGVLDATKDLVGDTRLSVKKVGDAATKGAGALERADVKLGTFNENFKTRADALNATLDRVVGVGKDAVEVGKDAVGEAKRFNTTVEKVSSLGYISQMVAVSEVTKMATNFLVNFFAGGAYTLFVKAYHVITATMTEEERQRVNSRADAAMRSMKDAMNQIGALDVEISVLTMGLAEVSGLDGKTLLESLNNQINIEVAKEARAADALKQDPDGPNAQQCSANQSKHAENLFYLRSLRKALSATDTKEKMCKKFESTFGSWVLAINALQEAKNTLDVELTTIFDQYNEKALAAQETVTSPRYYEKKCTSTQADLIAGFKRDAERIGCTIDSKTPDCVRVYTAIHDADGKECAELLELQKAANDPGSMARRIEARNAAMKVVKANLLSITKLDCVAEGDVRPQCNNTDGDITMMKKLYVDRLRKVTEVCPPGSFNPIAGLNQRILAEAEAAKPYTAQISEIAKTRML